ncbi:homoserine kinase [Clostridium sp. MD294]|uniref:homoserine kinase n=1 Tax=Clostridium sp. MD294 TaxID=97138 RepID=UPI0002C9C9C9|nr:homoserine kinase [Clostridium sp. MD294]NDO47744.1 homoserine kinase [Clostridium sp. MD294]USF29938.1 Homoserine kinase [Clostridium sp. MD294]
MIHIKVPATSANMGPGFDSIGVALQLYNHLWFEQIEEGLEIIVKRKHEIEIPTDKNNLIYKTMVDFFAETGNVMPPVRLIQEDYIPMVRGLGSSAACIVAGLLAANHLSGCHYSKEELSQIAAKIEGHPDNSNPALFGGMVVGATDYNEMRHVRLDLPSDLVFAIMVPNFPVSTHDARRVLPSTYDRSDAVFNASRAALLVASIYSGNYENLSMAMQDSIHQPYRSQLIPDMERIFKAAKNYGALGAYLSGAGSTLMAVLTDKQAETFQYKMAAYLKAIPNEWQLTLLKPDEKGAQLVAE